MLESLFLSEILLNVVLQLQRRTHLVSRRCCVGGRRRSVAVRVNCEVPGPSAAGRRDRFTDHFFRRRADPERGERIVATIRGEQVLYRWVDVYVSGKGIS